MRKVTNQSAQALIERRNFSSGNTIVRRHYDNARLFLHGNLIAEYNPTAGTLFISDAGWRTVTTKERLNGILTTFKISGGLSQKDYSWYFKDGYWTDTPTEANPWDGHWTETLKENWTGDKLIDLSGPSVKQQRLETIRRAIRAENVSYSELAELESLADHIEPGDVELLEAAGVKEAN